jgi:hypothetical protein
MFAYRHHYIKYSTKIKQSVYITSVSDGIYFKRFLTNTQKHQYFFIKKESGLHNMRTIQNLTVFSLTGCCLPFF